MIRPILAFYVSLLCLFLGTFGRVAKGQQEPPRPQGVDFEYRKFQGLLSFLRTRNAQQYAIVSPKGIDEAAYVKIGGIEQWITIRGEDRESPVLLFLHGGPGDVTTPWSFMYFAPWQKQFTVVQWDERGAGRTLRKNGPGIAPTIKVDRMVQDGIELTEYLRKHLGKEKIVIVGHSFGSLLAARMARARPELFYAYVGTGQVVDTEKNESSRYEALLNKAKTTGDARAIEELGRVGRPPYESGEGGRVLHKWANRFEGADQFLYGTIGLALVAPGYSMRDINASADGQMLSGERLWREIKAETPNEVGLEFAIPFFVFQGEEDFTTSTALAQQYAESVKAPRKEFVVIKSSGHFAVFMRSNEFLQELVVRVRPLALAKE